MAAPSTCQGRHTDTHERNQIVKRSWSRHTDRHGGLFPRNDVVPYSATLPTNKMKKVPIWQGFSCNRARRHGVALHATPALVILRNGALGRQHVRCTELALWASSTSPPASLPLGRHRRRQDPGSYPHEPSDPKSLQDRCQPWWPCLSEGEQSLLVRVATASPRRSCGLL